MSVARYGALADRIAREAGIPPALFRSLISAESSWNPNAGSHMGARGLAQLMPETARGLGVTNILDPEQNLRGGARYLADQYRRFKRWDYALAAYNAGPGAVQQYGGIPPFRETQAYVPRVLGGRTYPALGSPAATAPSSTPTPPTRFTPADNGPGGSAASPQPRAAQSAPTTATLPTAPQIIPGSIEVDPRGMRALAQYSATSERDLLSGNNYLLDRRTGQQFDATINPYEIADLMRVNVTAPQVIPGVPGVTNSREQGGAPGTSIQRPADMPQWTIGGRPGQGTHSRTERGNQWTDDNAYDLMGKAGDPVYAGTEGTVVRISGQPGGDPRFAGYGITVRTRRGQVFYKHLGSRTVNVGDRVTPTTVLGTLDARTAGGPHLHLGSTHAALLNRLRSFYVGGGQPATAPARSDDGGDGAPPQTGGGNPSVRFSGTYNFPTGPADSGRVVIGGTGGDWGGSMPRALHLARAVGITPSSQKRQGEMTADNNPSDHWVGLTNSYAVDLGGVGAEGDAAYRKVMRYLARLAGKPEYANLPKGEWQNLVIGGYRYQVGWQTDRDHYDHVHVGVRRV